MPLHSRAQTGFTVTELLFAAALAATMTSIAVPLLDHAADDLRTAMAARYVAGRIHASRLDALKRSSAVALRFLPGEPDYTYRPFVDGNGNGIRTADIVAGIDKPSGGAEQLGDKFGGVRFGLQAGLPDADGVLSVNTDGVRIGTARILTLSPDGTATPGTLYLHGRRAQYAVRVMGLTARTRVLKYERGASKWTTR
jgi:hypothetical protein